MHSDSKTPDAAPLRRTSLVSIVYKDVPFSLCNIGQQHISRVFSAPFTRQPAPTAASCSENESTLMPGMGCVHFHSQMSFEAQPGYMQLLPCLGYTLSAYSAGLFFVIDPQKIVCVWCMFHLSFLCIWRRLQRGFHVCSFYHPDQMSSSHFSDTIELDKQEAHSSPRSFYSVFQ